MVPIWVVSKTKEMADSRYLSFLLLGRKKREEAEDNDYRPLASHQLEKGLPGRRDCMKRGLCNNLSYSHALLTRASPAIDVDAPL